MIDLMMLAISLQRLITAKAVGAIDLPLSALLSDVLHQITGADAFDDASVNMAFSLQQPKNKALSGCAASTLTFTMSSKVSLIKFDLATKPPGLKLGRVIETFSQVLMDARECLLIQLQVSRKSVSRHLLIKAFDDLKLSTQLRKRLLSIPSNLTLQAQIT